MRPGTQANGYGEGIHTQGNSKKQDFDHGFSSTGVGGVILGKRQQLRHGAQGIAAAMMADRCCSTVPDEAARCLPGFGRA